jgi:regulator of protease activity HflC (stomatin/prohibitin superfamily)
MESLLITLGVFFLISAFVLLVTAAQRKVAIFSIGAVVALIAGLVFIFLGLTIVSVGPSERMVVFNRLTGDLGNPRGPGITVVNPITTSYRIYDMSRQTYTMSALRDEGEIQGDDSVSARTSGGQEVFVDLTMIYRIDPNKINQVHVAWPNDRYRTELIRPLLRSTIRDAVSLFDVESVYQERDSIQRQIQEEVVSKMEAEGFLVTEILVRNITFTSEYALAIENAQIAEVKIREQEFRVREVEQQAAQARERAEGEAAARLIQAEAEAEALRLLAEVLAQNPALIQYQYVQNLSDNVQILGLPAASPFIFDLTGVIPPASPGSPAP